METKFTPGPWVVDGCSICPASDISMELAMIGNMDVGGRKDFYIGEISNANAHMLAAAPDLYHALEYLFRHVYDIDFQSSPEEAQDKAEAALAKARGKTLPEETK